MRTTLTALVTVLALTACGGADDPRPTPVARSASPGGAVTTVTFESPARSGPQPAGVTYDTAVVPVGATAAIGVTASRGRTRVTLTARKLPPNRVFGAHVHTSPCGAKPADAGPHYQNRKDPVSPSVDPAYANPRNEVWLDFVTNDAGTGTATATVAWNFRPGQARSVVIHAERTKTHAGHAGTAGARLACATVTAF